MLPQEPQENPIGALVLARAGDKPAALAYIDQSSKANPQDTLLRNYWIPTIRAALSLSNHDPMDAVHQLDGTLSYELGSVLDFNTAPMFPVYLHGQAFLAMNKGAEAAAEFQKYVDHPGVVQNYPLAALARPWAGPRLRRFR